MTTAVTYAMSHIHPTKDLDQHIYAKYHMVTDLEDPCDVVKPQDRVYACQEKYLLTDQEKARRNIDCNKMNKFKILKNPKHTIKNTYQEHLLREMNCIHPYGLLAAC